MICTDEIVGLRKEVYVCQKDTLHDGDHFYEDEKIVAEWSGGTIGITLKDVYKFYKIEEEK